LLKKCTKTENLKKFLKIKELVLKVNYYLE
jgi:hypothetical protein